MAKGPATRRPGVLIAAGAAIVLAGAAAWLLWPAGPPAREGAADTARLALGAAVYRQHCASCHGASLEGQPAWRVRKPDGRLPAPPHDETGHTWHHPDEQLFRITKFGLRPPLAPEGYVSDMPGFAGRLRDEEIRAVIAFIKSRWPPAIRARQRQIDEAARRR